MKFSFRYVKEHPYLFGSIVVIFGVILWIMMSGKSSSSGTTTVTSGVSDAQAQAAAQLGMAQLAANTQIGLAQISANTQTQGINAQLAIETLRGQLDLEAQQRQNDRDITLAGLQANLQAAGIAAQERISTQQINAQLNAQHDNNQFQLDYAKLAYNSATTQLLINADLQKTLSTQQLEAYKDNLLISQIGSLKKKDRDETLQILGSAILGAPVNFINAGGPAIVGSSNIPASSLAALAQPNNTGGGGFLSFIGSAATGVVGAML